MKEIVSTLTSKGQVTIPVEVRRHLALEVGDKVSFVIEDDGEVTLRVPRYPTIASLAGKAGRLDVQRAVDEMVEIARDDALTDEYAPKG